MVSRKKSRDVRCRSIMTEEVPSVSVAFRPSQPAQSPVAEMQSLSSSAYADAFGNEEVSRVNTLLTSRVQGGRQVRERLAEYFAARAEVSRQSSVALEGVTNALYCDRSRKLMLLLCRKPSGRSAGEAVTRRSRSTHSVLVHPMYSRRCSSMNLPILFDFTSSSPSA